MNRTIFLVVSLLFGNAGSIYLQADEVHKYALLVGVTKYSHAAMNEPVPLEFPEADAQAVGKVLRESGYEVDFLLGAQATQTAIQAKLDVLGSKGNQAGVVVVGFWGHGVEIDGSKEAMFCPFDTTLHTVRYNDGSLVRDKETLKPLSEPDPKTLISMSDVLAAIGTSGAGNRILLADCCRNSPHVARGRAFGSSVKLSDLPANTAALFGCSAGEKAFEYKPWGHGAFTKSLLDLFPQMAANQDDIPAIVGRLQRSVADSVSLATNDKEKQTLHSIINGIPRLQLTDRNASVVDRPLTPKMKPTPVRPNLPTNSNEEYFALIIGVNHYADKVGVPSDLRFAVDDALAIEKSLIDRGFSSENIVVMTSAQPLESPTFTSAANIRRQLDSVVERAMQGKVIWVCFAGYELQVADSDDYFLFPTDGLKSDPATLINLKEIYAALERVPDSNRLIVLDSCRGREKATPPSKQPKYPPPGIGVLIACSAGEYAREIESFEHGVFTYGLLQTILGRADINGDEKLTVKEVVEYVSHIVPALTQEEQNPEFFGELSSGVSLLPIMPSR